MHTNAYCILLISLFSFSALNVCSAERDSLIAMLKNHRQNDSEKVKLLGAIGRTYAQSNIDSMETFAAEGLAIANRINFESGIGKCSELLGLVFLHKHESARALQYYQGALGIYIKNHNQPKQADLLTYIGDVYYRDTKYDTAIDYYNKAVAVSDRCGDLKQEGLALIDIGGIYTDQGSFAEAVNYYLKGLGVFEKQNDPKGISMTLVNIANIYAFLGNYEKAKEYVSKSIPVTKGITDKEVIFSNMVNIGVVYSLMKDYKNALDAFSNGLLIADTLSDKTWQNVCLVNIADVYYQTGAYDTSYAKYSLLLSSGAGIADTGILVSAKSGMGSILLKKGKIKEGIRLLNEALQIALEKQLKQTVFDDSRELADAYERIRDYKSALRYHKIYYSYRDSLNNDKNNKRIQQLQFDYELGKKEHEIEILKKDTQLAESRAWKQRVTLLSLSAGLLLLAALTIILYRSSLYEKKSKAEIVKQKEEIQQQASRLEELNRFKDKTFSVLSHDLRSPLSSLTSILILLDNDVISQDEFATVKHDLSNQLNSVNILLDNLLHWAKSYFQGKIPANAELINLYDITARNIRLVGDAAAAKQVTIVNEMAPVVNAYCDAGQMDIVTRNLLSNAVKFTRPNGTVRIKATERQTKVELTIADDGVGMTPAQLDKIFSTSADNSTFGTAGERGIGLGLFLCYEFIKANDGSISVSSEVDKGTTFVVELPRAAPNPTSTFR